MRKITEQDIFEAYRKLKNHYYFDNSTLHTRKRIALFERVFYQQDRAKFKASFLAKCSELLAVVNDLGNNEAYFTDMLSGIDCYLVPKSLYENRIEGLTFISNVTEQKNIRLEKYNVMIDAPIEIHLISTLWLMFVGVYLSKLVKAHNYAYNFTLFSSADDEKLHLNTGLQLYTPYYKGYQDWRDNALKEAEQILNSKKNATIVSLDIQRYFYNVRINLPEFFNEIVFDNNIEIPDEMRHLAERLTALLHRIHLHYQKILTPYINDVTDNLFSEGVTLLPVGLLSSGLLGNLYLYKFDRLVMENLHPDYYGRYVDDMLIVLGETKVHSDVASFLSTYFTNENRGILIRKEIGKEVFFELKNFEGLSIQEKKLVIQNFAHYESRAAIKKFRSNINKQRSEFRFLPDEDILERDFEESAFTMQYSGSVNTFHSIKDFRGDKFGASSYLAHSIFLACYDNSDRKKNTTKKARQILTFFKGNVAIEFYSLWEKVATYFVISEDVESLNVFEANVIKAIDALEFAENPFVGSKLKDSLINILSYSIAMPISMHRSFIRPSNELEQKCYELSLQIRHSNMFRHQFLGVGGLNLTDCLLKDDINLYDTSLPKSKFNLLKGAALYLMPHHVHFNDINQILFLSTLIEAEKYASKSSLNKNLVKTIEKSKKFFEDVNFKWKDLFRDSVKQDKLDFIVLKDNVCKNEMSKAMYVSLKETDLDDSIKVDKKVAIANIKVDEKVIERMAIGKVNMSKERRKDLFRIINDAVENRCDILVLPELSVPYQWLDLLTQECRKHNLAIICGLTYIVNANRMAFNKVVSILPVKTKYYTTSVIVPRIKNHYSPDESQLLTSYGYHYPRTSKTEPCVYDLIHWRKCYFSVYNCFELSSIEDRSLFKSKVDFIVATELNRDTKYYSDIIGSWVRDIHCFIIQVNTSNYGDSRIVQPSKSEIRDQIIVKGGRNATMLYDVIEIDNLRKFQLPGYYGQDQMGNYKKTPPQFSKKDVETRIHNKEFK